MKTIVDYRQKIILNGEEFDTSIRRHLCYAEPKKDILNIDTFEELVDLAEENYIYNAKVKTSFFTKKKIVSLFNADLFGYVSENYYINITEKNFKPFQIKCEYQKDTRKNSFNTLMELLSADDFAEWCKDHGITTICT